MNSKLKSLIINFPVLKQLYQSRLANLKHKEQKITQQRLENWRVLFENKQDKKMMHTLQKDIQINLYEDSVLSRLIFEGGFEKDELEFITNFLKKGDHFIDIGTNIGLFSIIAAHVVGPTGKVTGFEPSPKTFSRLVENLALTPYKNYEVRNIGISDTKGYLNLNLCEDGFDAWDSFADSSSTNAVKVPVSTLDDELAGTDMNKIALVKIDVEGWEKFVLLGAQQFLTNYSPTLLIEFTEQNAQAAGYDIGEIYDIMVKWGYQWYEIHNGVLLPSPKKKSYPYSNLIAKK